MLFTGVNWNFHVHHAYAYVSEQQAPLIYNIQTQQGQDMAKIWLTSLRWPSILLLINLNLINETNAF